jgi:hypothetical protein
VDQQRMWLRFLESSDDRVALDASKYLNDRVHGKPKQAMQMAGEEGGPIEFKVTRVVCDL